MSFPFLLGMYARLLCNKTYLCFFFNFLMWVFGAELLRYVLMLTLVNLTCSLLISILIIIMASLQVTLLFLFIFYLKVHLMIYSCVYDLHFNHCWIYFLVNPFTAIPESWRIQMCSIIYGHMVLFLSSLPLHSNPFLKTNQSLFLYNPTPWIWLEVTSYAFMWNKTHTIGHNLYSFFCSLHEKSER